MKRLALVCISLLICGGAAFCQTPVIADGGVLNAASFDKTPGAPLAPGSLVSIFGSNLASQLQSNDTVPLSTSLADKVSVTFNGITAGLDFVSGGQINAQLPWNVLPAGASTGTATVVVSRNGNPSATQLVNIGLSPAIFSVSFGAGYALAFNLDGTWTAPVGAIPGVISHPAKAGDVLIVYANGLGAVDSPIDNGADSTDKLRNTLVKPIVLIGGQQAILLFSGLAPAYPGVNQLNIQVPAGVTPGDKVPLQLQINGPPTTANVVIGIQ